MQKKLILFLFIAPIFGAILAFGRIYYSVAIWKYQGQEIIFEIKPGEGFSSINYRLSKEGIIGNPKVFHRYGQLKGFLTKFRAGKFVIPSGSNMQQVVDILLNATPLTNQVTIPEGKNMYEIAKILEEAEIVKSSDFLKSANDSSLLKTFGVNADSAEGYLYPDTYRFSTGTPGDVVLRAFIENFRKKTAEIQFGQMEKFSEHQIITLASIVEKETGAKEERPAIAGVFHNRLKKKMRLQSDPTTIYGIWERYKGNIRKADLMEKNDYNTYQINGLPKGPIANPGIESIKATLSPEPHEYLYFVSQNNGKHVFTKTYKEHLKAVEFWQKTRSNREGRSWRNLNEK